MSNRWIVGFVWQRLHWHHFVMPLPVHRNHQVLVVLHDDWKKNLFQPIFQFSNIIFCSRRNTYSLWRSWHWPNLSWNRFVVEGSRQFQNLVDRRSLVDHRSLVGRRSRVGRKSLAGRPRNRRLDLRSKLEFTMKLMFQFALLNEDRSSSVFTQVNASVSIAFEDKITTSRVFVGYSIFSTDSYSDLHPIFIRITHTLLVWGLCACRWSRALATETKSALVLTVCIGASSSAALISVLTEWSEANLRCYTGKQTKSEINRMVGM